MKKFQYYMFDFDGTLADSQWYWQTVLPRILKSRGYDVTDADFALCSQSAVPERWAHCRDRFGLSEEDRPSPEEVREWIDRFYQTEVCWKEGAVEYLRALKASGAKTVLFSATPRNMILHALQHLEGEAYFDYVFSAADLGVGKGDPQSYSLCLAALNASPEDVVMFEDALYSMKSAKALGIYTVAVHEPCMLRLKEEIDAVCDRYVEKLSDCLEG